MLLSFSLCDEVSAGAVSTLLEILPPQERPGPRGEPGEFQPFLRFYVIIFDVHGEYGDLAQFQPFLRFYFAYINTPRRHLAYVVSTLLEILLLGQRRQHAVAHRLDVLVSTLLEILLLMWLVVVGF